MFQVASHPASYAHHGAVPSTHSYGAASQVALPRNLARPPFREISRDAIACAAPELANVPSEYIRNGIVDQAPRMLAGNASLSLPANLPRSRLPSSINAPLRPQMSSASPMYPTHILAISQASKGHPSNADSPVSLFPIHALVFASNCASLPRLPPSSQYQTSHNIQLPILVLSVPSPAAFSLIHSYLYTHSCQDLLSSLLPLPPNFTQNISMEHVEHTMTSRSKLQKLSHFLCSASSGNPQALMAHAAHVKELWQDCAALGIQFPELWTCIDLAWEIVLGAFNLCQSSQ